MKNEFKITFILLIIALFYIFYTSGKYTNTGEYERLYNEARESIGTLQENNNLIKEKLIDYRELQEELSNLQLSYKELEREREETLNRRERLESIADNLNRALGDEIERAFGVINQAEKDLR